MPTVFTGFLTQDFAYTENFLKKRDSPQGEWEGAESMQALYVAIALDWLELN